MTLEDLCNQLNGRFRINGLQVVLWTLDLSVGSIKGVDMHGNPCGTITRQVEAWSYDIPLRYITVTATARGPWRAIGLATDRAEFGEASCRTGERVSVKFNPNHCDYGRLT